MSVLLLGSGSCHRHKFGGDYMVVGIANVRTEEERTCSVLDKLLVVVKGTPQQPG